MILKTARCFSSDIFTLISLHPWPHLDLSMNLTTRRWLKKIRLKNNNHIFDPFSRTRSSDFIHNIRNFLLTSYYILSILILGALIPVFAGSVQCQIESKQRAWTQGQQSLVATRNHGNNIVLNWSKSWYCSLYLPTGSRADILNLFSQ